MNKQEVIRKAWGKNYDYFKYYIDKDGWAKYPHFQKHEMIENVRPIEFNGSDFRPKYLQGIETNNFWIKIESEADLPKHQVWLSNGIDIWQGCLFIHGTNERMNLLATHFQPITKPLKPIY